MSMQSTLEAAPRPERPTLVSGHPVIVFFVLAYAFSWAVELPLVASARGWTQRPVPLALHYLGAYGPLVAAVITTWLGEGVGGVRRLLGRMIQWRVRPVWWLVAASPLVLYGLTAVALRLMRGTWIDASVLGRVSFLPSLGIGALALWIVNSGLGEETGWRGYALPRLQQGRSALSASLILSLFWIGWHLPTFLYLPSYLKLGLSVMPMFALGIAAGSVVLTWLYNGSRGSLLMAILWHGAFNYVTSSPEGDQDVTADLSSVPIVWAIVVILVWKPATLSPEAKQLP